MISSKPFLSCVILFAFVIFSQPTTQLSINKAPFLTECKPVTRRIYITRGGYISRQQGIPQHILCQSIWSLAAITLIEFAINIKRIITISRIILFVDSDSLLQVGGEFFEYSSQLHQGQGTYYYTTHSSIKSISHAIK